MRTRTRYSFLALAGVVAALLLSGCGGSSSTIPATATVFYAHTAVFSNSSTLLATGYNAFGQLGNGNKDTKDSLTPVVGLGRVSGVALGADHTVAFANQSTVYAWGSNYHGQIGSTRDITGVNAYSSVPVKVPGPKDLTSSSASSATNTSWGTVSAVAAGGFHSLVVGGPDRRVYAWGYNGYGQLGNGLNFNDTNTADIRAVQLTANGNTPLIGVVQLAAGGAFSLARTSDGRVYAWGDNAYGQLGIDPAAILGTFTNTATPVSKHSDDANPLSTLAPLTHITQIAAGGVTSYALGYATDINGNIPTDANGNPVYVQKLWGWGYNAGSQLGFAPTTAATLFSAVPVSIPLPSVVSGTLQVAKIVAGNDHLLILLKNTSVPTDPLNGSVWALGFNRFAQLGNTLTTDSSSFVQVQKTAATASQAATYLTGATDIIAFGNQSLALAPDASGRLVWYGWGDNGYGQLGNSISSSSIGYLLLPAVVRGF